MTIRFGWLRETVLMWVSGTGVCLVLLACGGGGGGTGVGNTSPSPFPPSIVSFLPGKGALTAGQGTTLTAVYTNATSATVDQGVGAVQSGVPVKVSPEASTNYTLTALGQGASATATLTLTVVPPPAISSFSASTQDVLAGGTTQLTPQFSGGAGTIDQGIGAVISGVPVTTSALNGATTFTLTVTNAAGDSVQLALPVAIHDRVTFLAGSGGTLVGSTLQDLTPGTSCTAVTAVPATGYAFSLWTGTNGFASTSSNPLIVASVNSSQAITAKFTTAICVLTYVAGANGSLTGSTVQSVAYGGSGTAVTAVPSPGYHFVQWSDGSTVNPRTDTSVTANVSVTATFAINTLTLAYAAGANGTLTGTSSQIVSYLASGTAVTAVPSPGYHFVQWSDGSTVNPRTDTSVTANVSVTATFAINTFTISFQAGPNGTVGAPTSQVVNYGGNTTLIAALPSSGYTFLNWTGTNGFVMTTTNPVNVTNVTSDMTVTANFTNLNVVNFMAGSGGTLTGTASQSVANGGSATSVTAVPNANYGFLNWTGTGGFITTASNPLTVFNVTGNMTLTANFLHVPIINYFATSSTTIGKGQTGVLNWSPISFATSASIDQGVGSVSTGSSYALVTPTVTTTYTLTATNSAGSSSSQTTITVVPAPVITSFTATPSAVVPGQPTTLAWTVTGTGPFTYSLNQGIGTVTGNSVNVTPPTGAIVYTLTVSAYGVVQANVTVLSGAPATLSYTPSTLVYSKNVAITPVSPASTGGTITSYWSSPSLPSGLSVDPNTGIISGTPTGIAALASYTITGDNVYGSVHTTVNVTVNDTPPSVTYGSGPFSYKVGSTVTLSPTNTGGAVTGWSISPSLPAGLTFNTSNGQITGIPSAITASQSYTVTATNSGGSSSPVLVIATSQTPPVIAYGSPSYTSYVGVSIRTIAPTNTGDPATWAIYPSLPQNLIFDSGSGQISGTPSGLSSGTLYTVEATNLAGSSQATFTLSVSVPAPVITTQPFGQILSIGAVPTFAVAATGTGTLTYQWYCNGYSIGGANNITYVAPSFQATDDGKIYTVMVSDTYGNTTTSVPAVTSLLHDLPTWLAANPNIAAAILWQFQAETSNVYQAPASTDKIAWSQWSASQQSDLVTAYQNAAAWYSAGCPAVTMTPGSSTPNDQPLNNNPGVTSDTASANLWVDPTYMWNLYVANVGFALMLETSNQLPWSMTTYTPDQLRWILDSSTMGWYLENWNQFAIGTYDEAGFPTLRANNRPRTDFADPRWTYLWLRNSGIIGSTRLNSIVSMLDWMRHDLWHFFGADEFGNDQAIWQYRGYAPLSKIINGTIDANNPSYGVQHWTAGCHGSTGFMHTLMRTLNIPVQPVWVCGHEMPYFMSEDLYMDHGDDPYNLNVTSSTAPSLDLLISSATWRSRFTSDETVNILDDNDPALAFVGYTAVNFPRN